MVELRIFGSPDIRVTANVESNSVTLQPRPLAIAAYLALTSAGRCRRDTLLSLFWPDRDEHHARNALSQALHRLRSALGKQAVASRGRDELQLSTEALWCDARAFREALANDNPAAAVELYRGLLLDGFHLTEAAEFERWLDRERERFQAAASSAAAAMVEREEAAGRPARAAHWLRRMLDIAPDDESALRRLMNLLEDLGDRAGAVRAYESFAQRLADDLDLTPDPTTQSILARIRRRSRLADFEAAAASIAVLPFTNLSRDPEQDYICDGVTEELMHALAQISGVRVVARTSVFALGDKPRNARALGEALGADLLLEGSVRSVGERLRITARLVDASGGFDLWSRRFDQPPEDLVAFQDAIARSIADTLNRQFLETTRRPQKSTAAMASYDLYLRGLFHRRKRTPEALREACTCFQRAVELDPSNAQAFGALGYTYALGGWFIYDAFAPRQAWRSAVDAAEKALELDDRMVEAHVALGFARWAFGWDRDAGEEALLKAISIDPGNSDSVAQYSSILIVTGRYEEAIEFASRAEALEPFWIVPKVYQGVWRLFVRRYDEAIKLLNHTIALEPRVFIAHFFLGDAYRFSGRLSEAEAAYRSAQRIAGRQPIVLGRLGSCHAAAGRTDEARAVIDELDALSTERYVRPTVLAEIHCALGDTDETFSCLERALEERDTGLTLARHYPAFDPLRSEPRFETILGRMGWPTQER